MHDHPSIQYAHAVVALHLWLAEIICGPTSHRVTGSARDVRRDLMGQYTWCHVAAVLPGKCFFCGGKFLGVAGQECVVLQTHLAHVWKRCRWCTPSGSSIFRLESVVLGRGQAEGAGHAPSSIPSCSSTAFPTLAGLTGAA